MSDEDLRAKLMTDGAPAHSALHMLIGSELAEIVRVGEFEFVENAVGCATSRITEFVIAASFAPMKGSPERGRHRR